MQEVKKEKNKTGENFSGKRRPSEKACLSAEIASEASDEGGS